MWRGVRLCTVIPWAPFCVDKRVVLQMKAESAAVYERNGALEDAADSYQSAADYFHAAVRHSCAGCPLFV
jgi:hypothetical protein